MPTYEFRCPDGHVFDRFYRKISDGVSELPCPECGKTATRQVSGGAGLVFKGSGFYLTDYGKNAHRGEKSGKGEAGSGDANASDGAASAGKSSDGTSSGGTSSDGASSPKAADGKTSDGKPAAAPASGSTSGSSAPKPDK